MKIKILQISERYIRFEIEGIDYAYANMIRRTLINDIPKLAIKNVIFHLGSIRKVEENGKEKVYNSSTPLFNEIISHRIGLIPLKTDLNMKFRDECNHPPDQACPLCTVNYTLTKFGPGIVYSGDLKPIGDEKFSPVDPDIPIVKLDENQALVIDAEAILGTGKEHARWQVTSGVSYKVHREFKIPKYLEITEYIRKDCPSNIISDEGDTMIVTDDLPCKHIAMLYRMEEVKIGEDENRFIFQFETDGSLTAKETLKYAIKRLRTRLDKIRDSVVV